MECPKILFVECDLAQAEWVCTGYISKDANMIYVIENNLDPHIRTAQLITGCDPAIIKSESKIVGHASDPEEISELRLKLPEIKTAKIHFLPRTMSMRQCGKKANHALNYNMQYRKFALWAEIEESEAARICSGYHSAYTGLKNYYRAVEEELKANSRELRNCFGYKRRFMGYWDHDLLDAAYAFKPQSTVARITNLGLRGIYRDTSLKRCKPSMQVHDSITSVVQPDSWEHLAFICRRIDMHMTTEVEYHARAFTLKRDFKLGPNWGKMGEVKGGITVEGLQRAWDEAQAA